MTNMIDSYGNIKSEYDANGNYIRGGYSLGSEIVQVEISKSSLDFIYQQ